MSKITSAIAQCGVEASWRGPLGPVRIGSRSVGRVATVDHVHMPFWFKPFSLKHYLASACGERLMCLFLGITICHAQQPSLAAERCSSRLGSARGFAARSMGPSVARTASPFSEMPSRTIPATWSDWEWSVNEVGGVFEGASEQPVTPQRHERRVAATRGCEHQEVRGRRPVQKLQQVLNILGDIEGPEVDGLRAALKRAETGAQGVPVDKQVKDCEAFLSRARAHLEEVEQKRSIVAASISAAEQRLVILKMQQLCVERVSVATTRTRHQGARCAIGAPISPASRFQSYARTPCCRTWPSRMRRLDFLVDGLPLYGGAQLAIDTTLVSPIRGDGTARPGTANIDGIILAQARRRKERTYPELVGRRSRARLVVLAGEVGGRWSEETQTFLRILARAKARSEPPTLRKRAEQAWRMRWAATLACSAARAFAASILDLRVGGGADGDVPRSHDVMTEFALV